jgi:hypothetical protein
MASGFAVSPQAQPQAPPPPTDPLEEWRALAQQVQMLIKKYPEAGKSVQPIMEGIKNAMTAVSANPQRTQERQAPPNG